MATTNGRRGGVVVRSERVGDAIVVHLDEKRLRRKRCPDHLLHLQDPPADPDDAVARLRWVIAWRLDLCGVGTIARQARVDAGRLMAFLEAPARLAGGLLTFAEAARLMRGEGQRVEDRALAAECQQMTAIAEPYLEAAGLNYGAALRQARRARRAHRAARPAAVRLA